MSRLQKLGKNIKKSREERGLSQEKLAELVDLSREYVVRIETGVKRISLKKLFVIADVLNVKCSELIDFD